MSFSYTASNLFFFSVLFSYFEPFYFQIVFELTVVLSILCSCPSNLTMFRPKTSASPRYVVYITCLCNKIFLLLNFPVSK